MKRISPYLLWVILAIPGIGMSVAYISGEKAEALLHPTGEFSARFMIIAMLASPLLILFRQMGWSLRVPNWLVRNRRYFGVAAFVYALLHTLFYLLDKGTLSALASDLPKLGIWTGWLAFLIFVPLAITSNDKSMRVMRASWKTLQRLVYPAAVLTLIHWMFVHMEFGPALVHFVPLAGLEAYRVYFRFFRKNDAVIS